MPDNPGKPQDGDNLPVVPDEAVIAPPVFQADTARLANVKRPSVLVQASYFEGPFPPPDILAELDKIVPGAAKAVIDDFVAQGNHRRTNEAAVISANIAARTLGMWLGFGLSAMMIVSGTIVAGLGNPGYGVGAISAGALLLATSYLKALSNQQRELKEKKKIAKDMELAKAKPPVVGA